MRLNFQLLTSCLSLAAFANAKGSGGRGGSSIGGRSHGGRTSLGSRGSLYGNRGSSSSSARVGTGLFGQSRGRTSSSSSSRTSSSRSRGRIAATGLGIGGAAVGAGAATALGSEFLRPRSPWSSWSEPSQESESGLGSQPLQWSSWSPSHSSSSQGALSSDGRNSALVSSQLRSGNDFRSSSPRDEHTRSILRLVTLSYTGSRVLRKVEERNAKVYLNKYRRYYWLGDRYYHNDPLANRDSRTTCVFPVGAADNLSYIDDVPIRQILFQCRRYYDSCCQLDCCPDPGASGLYSAGTGFSSATTPELIPLHLFILLFLLFALLR